MASQLNQLGRARGRAVSATRARRARSPCVARRGRTSRLSFLVCGFDPLWPGLRHRSVPFVVRLPAGMHTYHINIGSPGFPATGPAQVQDVSAMTPPPHRQSHAARARAGRHHEEGRDAAARGEGLQVGSFPLFAQHVRLVGARERLVKREKRRPVDSALHFGCGRR